MVENTVRIVRVFVASPGDVKIECDRVTLVITELNRSLDSELGIRLECIRWEDYVAPLLGRPEQVVLDQVELNKWDVFVGILWLRFGTPTGVESPVTENPILSGTEEEFTLAFKAWLTQKHPQILFYRCIRPPTDVMQIDAKQFDQVTSFFHRFHVDQEHPGIVRTYHSADDFERRLREDLLYIVRTLAPKKVVEHGPRLNVDHQQQGFLNLFLPVSNQLRNDAKRKVLHRSKDIRLMAHSGHSYFGEVGHKFRDELINRFNQSATFRAVLMNPWSETGFFIALSESDPTVREDACKKYAAGDISSFDVVNLIEQSTWYSIKLKDSIAGYKKLKRYFGEKIEVRFVKQELPATILLTEEETFFEPYLHVNLNERYQRAMLTFELHVTNDAHLSRHASNYFDMIWYISEGADEFLAKENYYRAELRKKLSS